jgi:hypothetical protein
MHDPDPGTWGFILSVVALVIILADRSRAKILERLQKLKRELEEANDLPLLEEGHFGAIRLFISFAASPIILVIRMWLAVLVGMLKLAGRIRTLMDKLK